MIPPNAQACASCATVLCDKGAKGNLWGMGSCVLGLAGMGEGFVVDFGGGVEWDGEGGMWGFDERGVECVM